MNLDHIFVDIYTSNRNPKTGDILEIAATRTDYKGQFKVGYAESVSETRSIDAVLRGFVNSIFAEGLDSNFVIIANKADLKREFLRYEAVIRSSGVIKNTCQWIDILAISWPLCYNDIVSSGDMETLAKHFEVYTCDSDSITSDVTMLQEVYWEMMRRYRASLGGEEFLRNIGGTGLTKIRRIIGL